MVSAQVRTTEEILREAVPGFALFLYLLLFLSPSPLLSCDPNHEWEATRAFSRRLVGYQAAVGLAESLLARARVSSGIVLSPGDGVAILQVADDFGKTGYLSSKTKRVRSRTPSEKEVLCRAVERFLASFLAQEYGARVVGSKRVAEVARRLGHADDSAYDPRVLASLAREEKVRFFLRVTLSAYGQAVRVYKDVRPVNKGLFLIHTFSTGDARLSLQAADGKYLAIDRFRGSGAAQFLFFGSDTSAAPVTQLIQVQAGRPGVRPANWQFHADRDHFSGGP